MNTLVTNQVTSFVAVIEQAGLPALRFALGLPSLFSCVAEFSSSAGDINFSIAI